MMDQFTKEGRKLRPRKTSSATTHAEKVDFSSESGRSEYDQRPHRSETGEHRSFHGSPRPGYQGGRTHRNSAGGARRSYRSEEGRPYSKVDAATIRLTGSEATVRARDVLLAGTPLPEAAGPRAERASRREASNPQGLSRAKLQDQSSTRLLPRA